MTKFDNIYGITRLIHNSIDIMQTKAENLLNPKRYHLSKEAKKRLKWIYLIHYECDHKISRAARKISISRQWLSTLHSRRQKNNRDPRSLEPESRAPRQTDNRQRISRETEDKIIYLKDKYGWGKEKIQARLKTIMASEWALLLSIVICINTSELIQKYQSATKKLGQKRKSENG